MRAARGFSMLELAVVIVLIGLLLVVSVPKVMFVWSSYQLSNAANEVDAIIKQCRSEAIRRNRIINCRTGNAGGTWYIWVDVNNDGVRQLTEPQIAVRRPILLPDVGVAPDTTSMGYAAAVTRPPLFSFDSRGAVNFGAIPPTVYVFDIAHQNPVAYGYRAVTLLPSGVTQRWGATQASPWHQY